MGVLTKLALREELSRIPSIEEMVSMVGFKCEHIVNATTFNSAMVDFMAIIG